MTVLVGVDAGATRTDGLATDAELAPLARARLGPGAVQAGRVDDAAAVIAACVARVLEEASAERAGAVAVGAAGAGREPVRHELERAVAVALGPGTRVAVTTDAAIALRAAFGHGPGIVLVAGTGSIAVACGDQQEQWRAGGYGGGFGDEGSGRWLAEAALRAVGRAEDGRGPGTALTTALLAWTERDSVDDLAVWAAGARPESLAALAETVDRVATAGDPVAAALVEHAAEELVRHVSALLERFPGTHRIDLALAGGLLTPGTAVRAAVVERLTARMARAALRDEPVDPARGAVLLARGLLASG